VSGEPEDMSLTLTQSRMSGLDSLTGSGLAREAQAVAANFQIQVPYTQQESVLRFRDILVRIRIRACD
jgi:hypothetical protein